MIKKLLLLIFTTLLLFSEVLTPIEKEEAKYNPLEAIQLWENIKKVSTNQPPEFLSTHPNHDERIEIIKEEISN